MTTEVARKIQDFFEKYPIRNFPKGQILIYAGDNPPGILYLVNGKVQQYDISYRGDEVVVNIFQPPAFFPMSWAVNKTPNKYFFQTVTDVELRQAPPEEALEFLQVNPDVMLDLLSRLYSGMEGLLRRMAHLMGGSASSRLLYELLIESKRFGELDPNGSSRLDVNESELATRTGMSRETVSRQMRKLKEQGLLEISRKGLLLIDVAEIETKLGSSL